MSTLKYHFSHHFVCFLPQANELKSFSAGHAPAENTPTRAPLGRTHQCAHWWGGIERGGKVPSFQSNYTNLAVFIFTPGPMVEAATQLRIY